MASPVRAVAGLAFALLASSCTERAAGGEGAPCYPNQTCNAGLVCLSSLCVSPGGDGGGSIVDLSLSANDAASRVDDAGLPCPGASIFHPGSETRMVGTSVPFVGRARDATCAAITGDSLVWTDNLEGPIGKGETFSYTFTKIGAHAVTLTATDGGGNKLTATVSFMIM
jgi:hypothetical protein